MSILLKVHSFIPDISIAPLKIRYYSEALSTTALILCRIYHTEALQITTSEGLAHFKNAQDPCVLARVGFEPEIFQMQGIEPTTEPEMAHRPDIPALQQYYFMLLPTTALLLYVTLLIKNTTLYDTIQ